MPLYNYCCDDHGEFADWRPMSEAGEPAACPDCGSDAPRAVSFPQLALMNATNRKAHFVNERSADSPRVETRSANGHGSSNGGGHGACGHDHGKRPGHRHGPSRPWMIGH